MYEDVIERIKRQVVIDGNDCWIWQGRTDRYGYGELRLKAAPTPTPLAHRISYEVFVGPIPAGLQIDHLCRVRACVNPRHLEPVTLHENMRRAAGHGVCHKDQPACKYGHPFTEANTLRYGQGYRRCRECNKRLCREHKDRRRAKQAAQKTQ